MATYTVEIQRNQNHQFNLQFDQQLLAHFGALPVRTSFCFRHSPTQSRHCMIIDELVAHFFLPA